MSVHSVHAKPARAVSGTQPQTRPPFGNAGAHSPTGAEVKHIASMLRHWPCRGSAPVSDRSYRAAEHPIPVLLASAVESDGVELRRLLAPTRYLVAAGADFAHASHLLCEIVFPILLCDDRFDGGNALASIGRLIGATRFPTVLLVSDRCENTHIDAAFDVLVRPFETQRLVAQLDSAHNNWLRGSAPGKADSQRAQHPRWIKRTR
jgi:hypothetical protein